jgi:hypothetical protein
VTINVPDSGTYYASASFTVTTFSDAGQSVTYPGPGVISMPAGGKIDAQWTDPQSIIVYDDVEGYGPALGD